MFNLWGRIMKYEIDFLGNNSVSQDSDSILFRYMPEGTETFIHILYDGGVKASGETIEQHLRAYYNTEKLDYVIVSHPDNDHTSGIIELLGKFEIGKIYMNCPWNYIEDLWTYVDDGRKTKESLKQELYSSYPNVKEIEDLANKYNIPVLPIFQGAYITDEIKVLSPSKTFYIEQIVDSSKNNLAEKRSGIKFTEAFNSIKNFIVESFSGEDTLRENVSTSAENETSVILHFGLSTYNVLLTGDAGIKALDVAYNFGISNNIQFEKYNLIQIPHHGSRHNISSSIIDKITGFKCSNCVENRIACASVARDSDHPRKSVVNAFIKRKFKVSATYGNTICHHSDNMPTREGWGPVSGLSFSSTVESWD